MRFEKLLSCINSATLAQGLSGIAVLPGSLKKE